MMLALAIAATAVLVSVVIGISVGLDSYSEGGPFWEGLAAGTCIGILVFIGVAVVYWLGVGMFALWDLALDEVDAR